MKYKNIRSGEVAEAKQITNKDREGIDYAVSDTAIFVTTSNGKYYYDPGDYLVTHNWGETQVLPCRIFEKEWMKADDTKTA